MYKYGWEGTPTVPGRAQNVAQYRLVLSTGQDTIPLFSYAYGTRKGVLVL